MPRGSRTVVIGWLVALLAIAAFVTLGQWQLGRMHQKQAMLDAVASVLQQRDARALSAAADPASRDGYTWSAGRGHFAEAPAVLLDNQMRDGRPGVRVYRVFVADAGGPPLLVELGWLPLEGRRMPVVERPAGEHSVTGLLLPPPVGGLLKAAPQVQPDGNLLVTSLLPAELAPLLGQPALAPRVLRLDPDAPLGHARDLDVLPNTLPPEKHLGYAVQWFALALAVLATAVVLTYRLLRSTRATRR
ncbi:MAG: SURF1 family protein [Pseudoxanthomonas suwonensis]|nr:SURF1 family protein [Pseudoxanthomonas suwonensis]